MSHPILARIPNDLLYVHGRGITSRLARAQALATWLQANNCRPTFAELDDERRRRSTDRKDSHR